MRSVDAEDDFGGLDEHGHGLALSHHVTVYRWVVRFTPLLAEAARPCRHQVGDRWRVDETSVKVAGRWRYVYRAIDQIGQVIDVYVSRSATARRPAGSSSAPSARRRCIQSRS